jgi:hypothetical protein
VVWSRSAASVDHRLGVWGPGQGLLGDSQPVATLQFLINNVLVAIRQNEHATACKFCGQAMDVLNANLAAFQALYSANNWIDLQLSLQGRLRKCAVQKLPTQASLGVTSAR